jgi:hypothetical protein
MVAVVSVAEVMRHVVSPTLSPAEYALQHRHSRKAERSIAVYDVVRRISTPVDSDARHVYEVVAHRDANRFDLGHEVVESSQPLACATSACQASSFMSSASALSD